MKNLMFFVFFNLFSLVLIAQTEVERKKIVETYNTEAIQQLKKELNDKYFIKQARIENYLKDNPKKSQKFKLKDKSYLIYDIINGSPIYITNDNINSAKATGTNELQTGGGLSLDINGESMTIGLFEIDFPRASHDEFLDDQVVPQSRITIIGNFFSTEDDHATHVGGTLIAKGVNASAKGMAPKASIRAFAASVDESRAVTEAANGLLISNHSYGIPISGSGGVSDNPELIGAYLQDARDWDMITFNAPYYLPVMSAGNEGGSRGNYDGGLAPNYDKLTGNKTAKNTLIVASALPSLNPSGDVVNFFQSDFSSPGPTDDFRVKPDIAGDGEGVTSPISGADNAYGVLQGSSMASPNVAGSLLLLQQYYNQLNSNFMLAATAKALVCHTAKDDLAKIGPDPDFGWGLLDAEKAANVIKEDSDGVAVINELTLNNNETYTYQFSSSGNGAISATICWTDPAGTASSSPGNALSPRLVNDLDVRIEDSGSTVYTPWKLDQSNVAAAAIKGDNTVDNIENIDINSGIAGNYTLTVTHKGSLTNGSQAFSLILTGANLTLGVSDKLISNVIVWPNPTHEKLNLSFESSGNKTNISLYDIHGREVYNKNLETISSKINHSIDTKAFYSGIYFLNIQNGSVIFNKKIIVE